MNSTKLVVDFLVPFITVIVLNLFIVTTCINKLNKCVRNGTKYKDIFDVLNRLFQRKL